MRELLRNICTYGLTQKRANIFCLFREQVPLERQRHRHMEWAVLKSSSAIWTRIHDTGQICLHHWCRHKPCCHIPGLWLVSLLTKMPLISWDTDNQNTYGLKSSNGFKIYILINFLTIVKTDPLVHSEYDQTIKLWCPSVHVHVRSHSKDQRRTFFHKTVLEEDQWLWQHIASDGGGNVWQQLLLWS